MYRMIGNTFSTYVPNDREYRSVHTYRMTRIKASSANQLSSTLFWVITQQVVVICYRRFGTCQSNPQGSRIKNKASWQNKVFLQVGVRAVKTLNIMVSANRVVASGWDGGEIGSQYRQRERERLSSSFLFYSVMYYHLLYWLLLISFLFYSSLFFLSHSVPALYSTFHSDVPSSARGIFTMQQRCTTTSHS